MRVLILTLVPFILSVSQPCLAFTTPRTPAVSNHRVGDISTSAREAFGSSKTQIAPADELEPTGNFLEPIADGVSDVIILGLRVGTCALMVHHGFDKIQHVDGFTANVVDKFFGFLPGPGKFWTLSAAGTQIVGAGLLSVGVLARPVALSMMATMVTAVIFHLLNTGENMTNLSTESVFPTPILKIHSHYSALSGVEGFPLGVPEAHSYNFEVRVLIYYFYITHAFRLHLTTLIPSLPFVVMKSLFDPACCHVCGCFGILLGSWCWCVLY